MSCMNCPTPTEGTYKTFFLLYTIQPKRPWTKLLRNLRNMDYHNSKSMWSNVRRHCSYGKRRHPCSWLAFSWRCTTIQPYCWWLVTSCEIKFYEEPGYYTAVHRVASLGTAPLLVALALIEGRMKQEDAVQVRKQKQHGDFNIKQLLYLEKYHSQMCLCCKDFNGQ